MNSKHIIEELDSIMEAGLTRVNIPYAKGKSVRIKNTVIRQTKQGFLVFDVKTHTRIAETFSKRGAIAFAKARAKGYSNVCDEILVLDQALSKHYMDSLFHKHGIEQSKDEQRKMALETRFEIAKDRTFQYMDQIDRYIFNEE
jgi:hypothetical protein